METLAAYDSDSESGSGGEGGAAEEARVSEGAEEEEGVPRAKNLEKIPDTASPRSPPEAVSGAVRALFAKREAGLAFNEHMTARRDFQNPYALRGVVEALGVEQNASCLPDEVYRRSVLRPEDAIEALLAAQEERAEAERAARTEIQFREGGGEPAVRLKRPASEGGSPPEKRARQ